MIVFPNARPIGLDELPVYSHWLPYLLGLKSLSKSLDKTSESVLREYGQDKWGVLLEKLKSVQGATIADADRLNAGESVLKAFYAEGGLYVADSAAVQRAYFDLIRSVLQPLVEQSEHLVELGAGYGALLLKLAALPSFERVGFTAGEYTDTGLACIDLLV